MEAIGTQFANGMVVGTTIALTALGLTLIFGIMHIVNLSHGEFYAMGAYFTWAAYTILNNFWVSAAIGIASTAVVGATLLMMFYGRLANAGPLRWALLTLGFGYVLREVLRLAFGTDFKLIPAPIEGTIPGVGGAYRVTVTIVGLMIIFAFSVFLKKSRQGILIRAIASNRDAAAIVGVSTRAIYTKVAVISAGLAGAAGAFMLPVTTAYPTMGLEIMIMAFVVVVVGGMGNIQGALFASILAGLAQSLLTLVVQPKMATITVLVVFILVLIKRREGLQKLW